MVKGILFDFGGVLAEVYPNDIIDVRNVKQMLEDKGVNYSEKGLGDMIKKGLKSYNKTRRETLKDLPSYGILKFIFEDEVVYNKLRDMSDDLIYAIDIERDTVKVRYSAYQVLQELKNRGYKLGLVSNTISKRVKEEMKKNNLSGLMETEVYSHEALVRKPNKEMFDLAVRKMNLTSEECVYVGDTVDKDVEGAKNAGFSQAILFDNDGDKTSNENYSAIRSLDELLAMFK